MATFPLPLPSTQPEPQPAAQVVEGVLGVQAALPGAPGRRVAPVPGQADPVGDVARNVGVLALFAVGALVVAALSMPRQTR